MYKDKVGITYGKLTILKHDGYYNIPKYNKRRSKWLCQCICGNIVTVVNSNLITGHTVSCGCVKKDGKKGKEHHAWKGGKVKSSRGYVLIKKDNSTYIPEHRLVMEEHLNRNLTKDETVHHINGIRTDNRLENLELWSNNHPTGQRVEDLIKWAKEILHTYNVV